MKMLLLVVLVLAVGGFVLLHHRAHAGNAQSVHDVVAKAPQLIGKHIIVAGVAGNNLAILGMGRFEIEGDDGSLLTVVSSSGVPLAGAHVSIHGVLLQAYASGSAQKLILIQDPPEHPNEESSK